MASNTVNSEGCRVCLNVAKAENSLFSLHKETKVEYSTMLYELTGINVNIDFYHCLSSLYQILVFSYMIKMACQQEFAQNVPGYW